MTDVKKWLSSIIKKTRNKQSNIKIKKDKIFKFVFFKLRKFGHANYFL